MRNIVKGPEMKVKGPDKIPAMLQKGEAVLPVKTVKAMGGAKAVERLIAETNGKKPGGVWKEVKGLGKRLHASEGAAPALSKNTADAIERAKNAMAVDYPPHTMPQAAVDAEKEYTRRTGKVSPAHAAAAEAELLAQQQTARNAQFEAKAEANRFRRPEPPQANKTLSELISEGRKAEATAAQAAKKLPVPVDGTLRTNYVPNWTAGSSSGTQTVGQSASRNLPALIEGEGVRVSSAPKPPGTSLVPAGPLRTNYVPNWGAPLPPQAPVPPVPPTIAEQYPRAHAAGKAVRAGIDEFKKAPIRNTLTGLANYAPPALAALDAGFDRISSDNLLKTIPLVAGDWGTKGLDLMGGNFMGQGETFNDIYRQRVATLPGVNVPTQRYIPGSPEDVAQKAAKQKPSWVSQLEANQGPPSAAAIEFARSGGVAPGQGLRGTPIESYDIRAGGGVRKIGKNSYEGTGTPEIWAEENARLARGKETAKAGYDNMTNTLARDLGVRNLDPKMQTRFFQMRNEEASLAEKNADVAKARATTGATQADKMRDDVQKWVKDRFRKTQLNKDGVASVVDAPEERAMYEDLVLAIARGEGKDPDSLTIDDHQALLRDYGPRIKQMMAVNQQLQKDGHKAGGVLTDLLRKGQVKDAGELSLGNVVDSNSAVTLGDWWSRKTIGGGANNARMVRVTMPNGKTVELPADVLTGGEYTDQRLVDQIK